MPPFLNASGLIPKLFEKVQQAKVPERYTTDFQSTVLGYGSGSARPFIPFLKRLGFIEADGRPTELYRQFRNSDSSGAAMATAMKNGFRDIFQRNEYAYKLGDDKLTNLVIEVTGKEPSDPVVRAITGSFKACNAMADFEQDTPVDTSPLDSPAPLSRDRSIVRQEDADRLRQRTNSLGLSYTINLNLPETADVEVFNAIFKALKENLLNEL